MKKKIVKAVFDIAHANGVDIGVGMDMFNHNVATHENINKGSDFDFTQNIEPETLGEAYDYITENYKELVAAYADGTIDKI